MFKSARLPMMLLLLLSGCSAGLPVLERTETGDATLGCVELDAAIDDADSVRDAAVEEGKVQAINKMIGAPSGVSAVIVLGVFAFPVMMTKGKGLPHELSRAAAEERIQQLLIYKRDRGCDGGLTGDLDESDASILRRLEEIDDLWRSGNITDRQSIELRGELFDLLR